MSLDVVDAVKSGFNRIGTRNAAIIASVYFIINVLNTAVSDTLMSKFSSQLPNTANAGLSLALPVPGWVAGLLLIPVMAASAVIGIAALRLFYTDEKNIIPKEHYAENIGKPVLNLIVGGFVFGLLVLGAILVPLIPGGVLSFLGFQIPGAIVGLLGLLFSVAGFIAVMVKLYFWTAAVAVDNQNFIRGFKTSWKLTENNLVSVAILLLSVLVLSAVLGALFSLPRLAGLSVVGTISASVGSAIASTLTAAILAVAYRQLKGVNEDEEEPEESEDEESENDEEEHEESEEEDSEDESDEKDADLEDFEDEN